MNTEENKKIQEDIMKDVQNISQNISSDAEYGQQNLDNIQSQMTANPLRMDQLQQASASRQPMQAENPVKQLVAKDISIIQNMMRAGMINPQQGQNLMNHVVNKAYEMVTTKQGLMNQAPANAQEQEKPSQMDFDNPDFFNQEGRSDVLEYLKKSNAVVDKDEISQITNLIEKIEQSAVDKYLRRQEHDKTLNDENEVAKQKLRTNAQRTSSGEIKNGVFTRDQIGKMSGAEFAKNERSIMEQLKKGMIR